MGADNSYDFIKIAFCGNLAVGVGRIGCSNGQVVSSNVETPSDRTIT
jgi:hypothetical protein